MTGGRGGLYWFCIVGSSETIVFEAFGRLGDRPGDRQGDFKRFSGRRRRTLRQERRQPTEQGNQQEGKHGDRFYIHVSVLFKTPDRSAFADKYVIIILKKMYVYDQYTFYVSILF